MTPETISSIRQHLDAARAELAIAGDGTCHDRAAGKMIARTMFAVDQVIEALDIMCNAAEQENDAEDARRESEEAVEDMMSEHRRAREIMAAWPRPEGGEA